MSSNRPLLASVLALGCSGCEVGDASTSIAAFVGLLVVVGVSVVGLLVARSSGSGAQDRTAEGISWDSVDVSALVIAIDWRARRQMVEQIGDLAAARQSTVPDDMARAIREVALALRRVETSWLYATVVNHQIAERGEAEGAYREAVDAAHSRFQRLSGPEGPPTGGERDGLAVLNFVVAAKKEIFDVGNPSDADEIRQLLSAYVALSPRTLASMEVVWSPETVEERMSVGQLEMLYPELEKFDERSLPSRVFCDSCAVPYPAEYSACPECG